MTTILKTFTEVCRELYRETNGKPLEVIQMEVKDKTTRLYFISRLLRRYQDAQENAKRYGFIGVGAISFAEQRLVRFQERACRRVGA